MGPQCRAGHSGGLGRPGGGGLLVCPSRARRGFVDAGVDTDSTRIRHVFDFLSKFGGEARRIRREERHN
eukprot:7037523-Pyramimonas_sp.AAC.1